LDAQLAILPHKPPPRPFGAQAHPIITLCVGLGICGGIYACYSGLLSRKHGKNVGVKNTPLPFYQERFNAMKRWLLLVASTLGFTSNTLPTKEEKKVIEKKSEKKIEVEKEVENRIFNDLANGFSQGFPPTQEVKEEEVKEEPWGVRLFIQMRKLSENKSQFESLWNEKINNNLTKEKFEKLDQQYREELNSSIYGGYSLLCDAACYLDLNHVKQLLDHGADASEIVGRKDGVKTTPLAHAIWNETNDRLEIAKELLPRGAASTINAQVGMNEDTVLHRAVYYNRKFELVKLLVENGALLDLKNKNGNTPLHYAAKLPDQEGKDNICRYLLENGADGNALNGNNQAPWQLAGAGSYDAWLKTLYPEKTKREEAIEKNTKAMEKFKK